MWSRKYHPERQSHKQLWMIRYIVCTFILNETLATFQTTRGQVQSAVAPGRQASGTKDSRTVGWTAHRVRERMIAVSFYILVSIKRINPMRLLGDMCCEIFRGRRFGKITPRGRSDRRSSRYLITLMSYSIKNCFEIPTTPTDVRIRIRCENVWWGRDSEPPHLPAS